MSKSRLVESTPSNHLDHAKGIKCEGAVCIFCELSKQVGWLENDLIGKILTIIDASIREERANKAMKDLLRQTIYQATLDSRNTMYFFIKSRLEGTLKNGLPYPSPGVLDQ